MDEYVDPEKEREEQLKLLQSYIGEAEDHMRKRDYKRAMEGYNLVCAYVLCVCACKLTVHIEVTVPSSNIILEQIYLQD